MRTFSLPVSIVEEIDLINKGTRRARFSEDHPDWMWLNVLSNIQLLRGIAQTKEMAAYLEGHRHDIVIGHVFGMSHLVLAWQSPLGPDCYFKSQAAESVPATYIRIPEEKMGLREEECEALKVLTPAIIWSTIQTRLEAHRKSLPITTQLV